MHANALAENIADIQDKDPYDIVRANPPFGGKQGAGVKTVVLFFEKGAPTRRVWFYQLALGRNLGKTNPLNDTDLDWPTVPGEGPSVAWRGLQGSNAASAPQRGSIGCVALSPNR